MVSRRGAAIKASAHFSRQLQSDDDDDSDGRDKDPESDLFGGPVRSKGRNLVKRRYGGRRNVDGADVVATPPSASPSKSQRMAGFKSAVGPASAPSRKKIATPAAKNANTRGKRPRSEVDSSPSDNERERAREQAALGYSDLTPLSSPARDTSMDSRTPVGGRNGSRSSKASAVKRTPIKSKALPNSLFTSTSAATLRSRHSLPGSPSALRHVQSSSSLAHGLGSTLLDTSARTGISMGTEGILMGNALKLDLFVWVLVDMEGKVIEDPSSDLEAQLDLNKLLDLDADLDMDAEEQQDGSKTGMQMWWPGYVSLTPLFLDPKLNTKIM